jgi:hypothetical protein
MIVNELIDKICSYGYEVNNRGYILKYSQKAKGLEICGQLNKGGAYFYAKNVSPFKEGQNSTKDILGGVLKHYKPIELPKLLPTIQHNFSFEDYLNTTNKKNQLGIYIKSFRKELLENKVKGNKYDIRGVKSGYLKDATLLPYIDKNNNFQTAKIVKYNTVSGKRSKEKYSANWFHAYKPIKEALGIEGNVSKSYNCFFGEHLIPHNNKPIVIVEGEKTAILLSDIYKNIVFVASGGLTQLERLDYSMMYGREVHLFPDNGASEWFEIAKYRGWNISKVLEQDGAVLGSDALDYYVSDIDNEIWKELHNELTDINYLRAEEIDYKGLNFQVKKKKTESFCLPNFQQFEKLVFKKDEAPSGGFKGKNFFIYGNNFDTLSANIDFNSWVKGADGWTELTAEVMLKRIEALYKIIKFLNPKRKYNKIVYKLIKEIRAYSNYEFNTKHVKKNLFPLWDSEEIYNAIQPYLKSRNWVFASDTTFKHNTSDFVKALNDDKKLFITNLYLKQMREFIKEKEYINITDIIDKKRDNVYLWNLAKEYNKRVLGCETPNQWKQKDLLEDYIDYCGEVPSNSIILRNTLVTRRTIEKYHNFIEDKLFYNNLIAEVDRLIDCPQCFNILRSGEGSKISLILVPFKTNEAPLITTKEAFNYELEMDNSVLNISDVEALRHSLSLKGGRYYMNYRGEMLPNTDSEAFLESWLKFNYQLTEGEMAKLKREGLVNHLKTQTNYKSEGVDEWEKIHEEIQRDIMLTKDWIKVA